MKYSTGCAFNMDEMFMNFPYKIIPITVVPKNKQIGNVM